MAIFQKFWKKEEEIEGSDTVAQTDKTDMKELSITPESQPFYKHPKILLIDIKDNAEKVLKDAKFNVKSGTFGIPYKVPQSSNYIPVAITVDLPNYEEQEIVIVDLHPRETSEKTLEKTIAQGDKGFWGKCNHGEIDPRPIASLSAISAFEKILSRNGVFVIFADNPSATSIVWASDNRM